MLRAPVAGPFSAPDHAWTYADDTWHQGLDDEIADAKKGYYEDEDYAEKLVACRDQEIDVLVEVSDYRGMYWFVIYGPEIDPYYMVSATHGRWKGDKNAVIDEVMNAIELAH